MKARMFAASAIVVALFVGSSDWSAGQEDGGIDGQRDGTIDYDAGLNVFKRLFHKPDHQAFTVLRDRLWDTLKSNPAIRIVEP